VRLVFREYRQEDREKIQNILIDKKRFDKYTLKTLKYRITSFLGLYRPYIYLLEDENNNAIIAMGVLIKKVDYSFRRMEWWIEAVNVAAEQRKLGCGTMLMNHVCAVLRKIGAKQVYLNFESDNVIAKAFYKKLGLHPFKRIFTMCKRPFSSVSPSSGSSPLIPVKPKKQREIFLRAIIPTDNSSNNNRLIGFYRKLLKLLHVLVTEVEEGMTTKGIVSAITFIYFYFMVRVELILPDMLDAGELEKIVRSEFSRFSLCDWRKIILSVICKGPNCEEWPLLQGLPKVSDVEDLVIYELM